jgi:uncharacterized protein (TIGR02996 family)
VGESALHPREVIAEQLARADRGRHPGFPSFNVVAGGPGSLAERSAAEGGELLSTGVSVPIDRHEATLVEAVCRDAENDAPRLAYADWLECSGEPILVARGRLIRVQCRLTRLRSRRPLTGGLTMSVCRAT